MDRAASCWPSGPATTCSRRWAREVARAARVGVAPMRIDRIDLLIVRMPLLRSFQTSSSRKSALEHILVKAYSDGLVGWGECASPSDPYYCEEDTETCWHMLKDFLAPAVLGKKWDSVADFTRLYAKVRRNNFAKAGLEMAAWDLFA